MTLRARPTVAALPAVLAALWAIFWAAAALAEFRGPYVGVGEAQGMRLEIAPRGEGFEGALTFADRRRSPFSAERSGDAAEAEVETAEGRAYLHVRPEAIGAIVTLVPIDEAGALRADRAAALPFVREGVAMPDAPERFLPPPQGPVPAIEARAFVSSYPFWPPMAALWGYEAVEPRFRSVIRLFPLVQADLLWTLCRAPERTAALGEALAGQGVTCQKVVDAVRRMQASDAFDRFKRDVARERRVLMTAISCAQDLTRTRPDCATAGAETAKRALSMETAATALARYR